MSVVLIICGSLFSIMSLFIIGKLIIRHSNKIKQQNYYLIKDVFSQIESQIFSSEYENEFSEFKNNCKDLENPDDFIGVITNNKIGLSISDIQFLFHSYELNNNGFFYYDKLFKTGLKGEAYMKKIISILLRIIRLTGSMILMNCQNDNYLHFAWL